jgi:hypothetical protein
VSPPSRLASVAELTASVSLEVDTPTFHAVVYPTAAEGSITRRSRRGSTTYLPARPCTGSAARRAHARVRRFVVANRLNLHLVLTFAGRVTDRSEARTALRHLVRQLRERRGEGFPWLAVVEEHDDGGLHLHMATQGVSMEDIDRAWGLGHTFKQCLRSLEDRRAIAAYLCKQFEAVPVGCHRYEVAQGFEPEVLRFDTDTEEDAESFAGSIMGGPPHSLMRSEDLSQWLGPRFVLMLWDDEPTRARRARPSQICCRHAWSRPEEIEKSMDLKCNVGECDGKECSSYVRV